MADGVQMKKVGSAVLDEDVRQAHSQLNGVALAVNESFDVGGSFALYSGHCDLPGEQRINCRCTIISTLGELRELVNGDAI